MVWRGAVDLYQEPAAVALLANHAHSIRVFLLTAFRHRCFRALGQKPSRGSGGRDVTAVPRPGVSGSPLRVASKKSRYLRQTAEEWFLGRDHDYVGVGCEELYDAVGIPRCESGAEALEDVE